jgi:hypothetical protein
MSHIGHPCDCPECREAGVTHLALVRVPPDEYCSVPHWLHGRALGRWWAARAETLCVIAALKDDADRRPYASQPRQA